MKVHTVFLFNDVQNGKRQPSKATTRLFTLQTLNNTNSINPLNFDVPNVQVSNSSNRNIQFARRETKTKTSAKFTSRKDFLTIFFKHKTLRAQTNNGNLVVA